MTSSTSVGWDTALAGGQSAWSSPLPNNESSSAAADVNSLIDKTRTVKVDANDYSRFKNIGDAEEAEENKARATSSSSSSDNQSVACRNCHKTGAKLKCSICKKASYCARECQSSDWPFHKRICKKPEPEKKPEPPRKRPATESSSANKAQSSSSTTTRSTSVSSSSSSTTTTNTTKKKTTSSSEVVVVDEPDLPATEMRGYKNGLPYFHRELTETEQKLIGDIAPKKVEVVPEVVKPVAHQGSAWNAAGTFEERTFTKWAEQKWSELFGGKTYTEGVFAATLLAPEKITGDASICVVRGKKRYLFDFTFKLPFEVTVDGGAKYKGSYQMNEISNDEDYEISVKLSKKPSDATQATALQKFVASRTSGLQKEVVRILGDFSREYQQQ